MSCKDIGWFGAQALLYPQRYANKAISIAGDEMARAEAAVVFREVVGSDMPIAPCVIGKGMKFFKREALGTMFDWLKEEGYGADIQECRRINPKMQDYRTWLKESSGFVKENAEPEKH